MESSNFQKGNFQKGQFYSPREVESAFPDLEFLKNETVQGRSVELLFHRATGLYWVRGSIGPQGKFCYGCMGRNPTLSQVAQTSGQGAEDNSWLFDDLVGGGSSIAFSGNYPVSSYSSNYRSSHGYSDFDGSYGDPGVYVTIGGRDDDVHQPPSTDVIATFIMMAAAGFLFCLWYFSQTWFWLFGAAFGFYVYVMYAAIRPKRAKNQKQVRPPRHAQKKKA